MADRVRGRQRLGVNNVCDIVHNSVNDVLGSRGKTMEAERLWARDRKEWKAWCICM